MVTLSSGHICIIHPHQRGDMDISQPGSPTCAKHQGPCGGMPPETPKVDFVGGSTVFIRFQQNVNHYDIGFPGYMDISIATSDDEKAVFNTQITIGDRYEFAQAHQQNYSVPINIPHIQCDRCVLRLRYITHKPGNAYFYQCADIRINNSTEPKISLSKGRQDKGGPKIKMASELHYLNKRNVGNFSSTARLLGFAWNPERGGSSLTSIDPFTGLKYGEGGLYFSMGSGYQYGTPTPDAQSVPYVMDRIACFSREIPYSFMMEHHNGGLDSPPNKIIWIDLYAMEIANEYEVQIPDYVPVSSLDLLQSTTFLAFQMEDDPANPGNFTFKFATLTYMGVYQVLYKADKPETLYINFLWAVVDLTKQLYYVLIGNENSPFVLKSRIYTFDISKKNVTHMTELDVSEYTISAIQVYEKTGQLFAMSPGLYGRPYSAWSLVEVNPNNGTINKVFDIVPEGTFEQYYGGTVINLDQKNGILYYVLRVADNDADVIVSIDVEQGHTAFSNLTNLRNLHNLGFYDNGW
ncbi:uncharacterized protein [Amphiura filiformis]|uniref:uncharacterized protein n=1 Tax=Amphiura filiformis TaxID=82378 RepID=UPI003B2273D8